MVSQHPLLAGYIYEFNTVHFPRNWLIHKSLLQTTRNYTVYFTASEGIP
jgi:hypothetical protein